MKIPLENKIIHQCLNLKMFHPLMFLAILQTTKQIYNNNINQKETRLNHLEISLFQGYKIY